MDGKIVTIYDVIALNHILLDKELNYKVHLHDACGRQSLSIKKVDGLESEVIFTGQSLDFVIK